MVFSCDACGKNIKFFMDFTVTPNLTLNDHQMSYYERKNKYTSFWKFLPRSKGEPNVDKIYEVHVWLPISNTIFKI